MGFYSEQAGSQAYPPPLSWFYPNQGNFIAFVGNYRSRDFIHDAISAFREKALIASEGIAALPFIPMIDWSDHWSFWQNDYPAFMLTDTAPNRYVHYHEASDTPDKLNYPQMARVTLSMQQAFIGIKPSLVQSKPMNIRIITFALGI